MSSLTAIFGSNSQETDSQESEKLLQLYWNRAELKKEFASMRDEQFKLQDQLKQAEGATARVQQQLDRLEDLLFVVEVGDRPPRVRLWAAHDPTTPS